MGSRVFDGVDDIITVPHGTALNLTTWTVAVWVKRTGAGEADYRICGKATGTAAGALQVTGQSAAANQVRGRQAQATTSAVAITQDLPQWLGINTWRCIFVTYSANVIKVWRYNGTAVVEDAYSSSTTGSGAVTTNTVPLYIGNASDKSQTLAGKLAYLSIDGAVWTNAEMLAYATGTKHATADFVWDLQGASPEPNTGTAGTAYNGTVDGSTYDAADSPPVTYGGGTPVIPSSSGSDSWNFAGSGVGKRTRKSSGTDSWNFAGSGTGERTPKTSGTDSWLFTGVGAGKRSPKATGTDSWNYAGSGLGTAPSLNPIPSASGTDSWNYNGTGVGKRSPKASGFDGWAFGGAAVAKATPKATGSDSWLFAGSGVGSAPVVGVKSSSGINYWNFAGSGVGKRTPVAVGADSWNFTGSGSGSVPATGGGGGTNASFVLIGNRLRLVF